MPLAAVLGTGIARAKKNPAEAGSNDGRKKNPAEAGSNVLPCCRAG
jgi:hypothetical protein